VTSVTSRLRVACVIRFLSWAVQERTPTLHHSYPYQLGNTCVFILLFYH
jgi:hypothetical protein